MRHLWSFLAGLAVAPVTWVLVTLGQDGSVRTVDRWVEIGTYSTPNLIEPAVYLGVAGILLGLLGTLRFSPFGPLVAGLLLAVPYLGLFVAPFSVRDRVPDDLKLLGDPLPLRGTGADHEQPGHREIPRLLDERAPVDEQLDHEACVHPGVEAFTYVERGRRLHGRLLAVLQVGSSLKPEDLVASFWTRARPHRGMGLANGGRRGRTFLLQVPGFVGFVVRHAP